MVVFISFLSEHELSFSSSKELELHAISPSCRDGKIMDTIVQFDE